MEFSAVWAYTPKLAQEKKSRGAGKQKLPILPLYHVLIRNCLSQKGREGLAGLHERGYENLLNSG